MSWEGSLRLVGQGWASPVWVGTHHLNEGTDGGKVPGNFPTISIISSFMNDYRTLDRSDA